ncbi:MAG: type II secretion system protein [Nitrospirota bacterium]
MCESRDTERGFSYVVLMFAIVVIGLGMTIAARQWKVMVQRELEADLLAKGIEIQNALALYSVTMKAGRVVPGEVYPQSLAELTRLPKPFLRKVYLEPVGHGEWELVRAPTGGIMGVRSRSKSKPIRQHDFPPTVRHFEGRASYYDWVFQYPSPSMMLSVGVPGINTIGQGLPTPVPSMQTPVVPQPNPAPSSGPIS